MKKFVWRRWDRKKSHKNNLQEQYKHKARKFVSRTQEWCRINAFHLITKGSVGSLLVLPNKKKKCISDVGTTNSDGIEVVLVVLTSRKMVRCNFQLIYCCQKEWLNLATLALRRLILREKHTHIYILNCVISS